MIKVKVSWIKNTYLRRAVMVATAPLIFAFALSEAVLLTLAMYVLEPVRRLYQVAHVMRSMVPTFKEHWRRK